MNKKKFEIEDALKNACSRDEFGSLSQSFMCQSVGQIDPNPPICVNSNENLKNVLKTLKTNKTGCVQITDSSDVLIGIFSERDWILKISDEKEDLNSKISDFMTKNPQAVKMDTPVAYAINLMSKGGFRHIPVVDDENSPVGMLSVKNIIDFLANEALDALLEV